MILEAAHVSQCSLKQKFVWTWLKDFPWITYMYDFKTNAVCLLQLIAPEVLHLPRVWIVY